jgi:hypothetical protein
MSLAPKLPPKPNKPHKLTKHDLCGHIMAMKNLPPDTTTDTKNEVLLNMLLSYIDDADIIAATFRAGFNGISAPLKLIAQNNHNIR